MRLLSRIDRALNVFDKPGVVLIFLLPVFFQWIAPLAHSRFWLDETVTWWTTNHGLRELITRCTFWPGSILYNSLILLLRSLGVHREWMLRVPSLVAVALSAMLLFDLARRWFSPRVAIAASVFFCTQQWIMFAAADARPYGLGLLTVVAATWLMLRWLETQRMAEACTYGITAALMLHFHMLFATVLVFHAAYLAVTMPRHRQAARQAAMAVFILAALALPLLPQYLFAFTGRGAHTFSNPRTLWDLGRQFLPGLPLVAAAAIAALLPRLQPAERARIENKFVLLALLWAAVPMFLLFIAAKLSGSDLFVGRYLIPYVPGIALCFGMVLEYLSTRLRTGLVLLIFLIPNAISVFQGQFPSHTAWGNWAAAIEFVDKENRTSGMPVLMRSPFPESDFFAWRTEKMDDSALYAPLGFYRSPGDWHPLPVTLNSDAEYLIGNLSSGKTALFFVSREDDLVPDPYIAYLSGLARPSGEFRQVADFEGVRVFRLRR